jgi:hypothetical protein
MMIHRTQSLHKFPSRPPHFPMLTQIQGVLEVMHCKSSFFLLIKVGKALSTVLIFYFYVHLQIEITFKITSGK